jgi:hypothetical protein
VVSIHVLSERSSCSHGSWANNFALEEVLADTCSAAILAPDQFFAHTRFEPITGRLRNGRYRRIRSGTDEGADLLILVGMGPSSLNMLRTIPNWREKYGQVAAYIVDIYPPSESKFDRQLLQGLDALFVSYSQMVEPLEKKFGVRAQFLPQATDVFAFGGFNSDRRIDVAAFGRQPQDVVQKIIVESRPNATSNLFAWWSEQKNPYTRNIVQDQSAFTSILSRARISLCFRFEDTHPHIYRGVSPITARWFESAAAGCVIAGSRPSSPEGIETLSWDNSVMELSTDGSACVKQLRDLLEEPLLLRTVGYNNFKSAALGHDWGHRIVTILDFLSIETPPKLVDRLRVLADWASSP